MKKPTKKQANKQKNVHKSLNVEYYVRNVNSVVNKGKTATTVPSNPHSDGDYILLPKQA